MAKKSTRPTEPFWFTLPSDKDRPQTEQSRFRFRPLNQRERMEAMDNVEAVTVAATSERQLRFRTFQQARETVLKTLIETENFPSDAPLPYPGDREAQSRYVEMLDDADLYACGEHVFSHSTTGSDAVDTPAT